MKSVIIVFNIRNIEHYDTYILCQMKLIHMKFFFILLLEIR